MSETSNGWSNYETNAVVNWYDDLIQSLVEHAVKSAGGATGHSVAYAASLSLKEEIGYLNPLELQEVSLWRELMDACLREVNWMEIAESYLEEIDADESE